MQFDAARIEPLFSLEMGLPGNSFAFELARKMGLPESIVKDAEERVGEEFVGIERNLRKIARNRRALDEKLQKIRKTDATLENITDRYQRELEDLKNRKKEILDSARQEAQEIVRGANKEVEKTIRTIKEAGAEKEKTRQARAQLQGFIGVLVQKKEEEEKNREDYLDEKLRRLEERKARQKERRARKQDDAARAAAEAQEEERRRIEEFRSGPLKVGEKVRVKDNGMVGEVSRVSNKAVTVIIGNISSKLPLDRVERITSNEFKASVKAARKPVQVSSQDASISERKLNFKPELDIRGERVNDALDKVVRFVDDAIMLDMASVRIIHGKGTGALREEVQKLLRTMPGVTSVKDEDIRHGGTGVTVVSF